MSGRLQLTLAPLVADGAELMDLTAALVPSLTQRLAADVTVEPSRLDLMAAYDPARRQYRARRFLEQLEGHSGDVVLGLTMLDLFLPVFTFVFGEAMLGGRTGIVSLHRLDPVHYGLPVDRGRLVSRMAREAMHEIGHCLGLVHCTDGECAMYASHDPEMVDAKSDDYCAPCRGRMRRPAPPSAQSTADGPGLLRAAAL